MPSNQLTRALKSRTDLPERIIENISEKEGWDIIYKLDADKKKKRNSNEICFTGFPPSEKSSLVQDAKEYGMASVKSVTKSLKFLCAGPNAGPVKLKKAQYQGVTILSRDEFHIMLETGELPDTL